ncbi:hypothetical protein Bcenmc03_5180 [Burkholderia orbicola MC0-3]|uniref:Uncharacterized protein n=1 Tax=Burkholderia orbicola (strain MC0-3) TaxID=406425 RepID=B1K705_BURO0|nr:hypothetical protein Bcenmc03_5180 [Burkholderia orbicola MC0-3]
MRGGFRGLDRFVPSRVSARRPDASGSVVVCAAVHRLPKRRVQSAPRREAPAAHASRAAQTRVSASPIHASRHAYQRDGRLTARVAIRHGRSCRAGVACMAPPDPIETKPSQLARTIPDDPC